MPASERIQNPQLVRATSPAPPRPGVRPAQPRSQPTLDALLDAHYARLARLARRLLGWDGDVEDVLQDVFVAAYEAQGTWARILNLEAWLVTITVRHCRRRQRRRFAWRRALDRLVGRSPTNPPDEPAPAADSPSTALRRSETDAALREAIRRLSPADREVLVLRYLEGMEMESIASTLRVRRGALDVRLSRARTRLRSALEAMGIDHVDG